jgi:hypothetical protein
MEYEFEDLSWDDVDRMERAYHEQCAAKAATRRANRMRHKTAPPRRTHQVVWTTAAGVTKTEKFTGFDLAFRYAQIVGGRVERLPEDDAA